MSACPGCGEPRGGRYSAGGVSVCWPCWCRRAGHDPLRADPPATRRGAQRDALRLVERLTAALGPPCATPEWVTAGDGERKRADYRVFRWRCPACGGGEGDPDRIWRPFSVDSDGNVDCNAPGCSDDRRDDFFRGLQAGTPLAAADPDDPDLEPHLNSDLSPDEQADAERLLNRWKGGEFGFASEEKDR
jgi:hypothetical protein